MFIAKETLVIFIRMLSWKQRKAVFSLKNWVLKCKSIYYSHEAVWRCDTVSARYGQSKLTTYKKLHESNSWRDVMHIVDDGDVNREYILEMGEKFNMELHGKNIESLDHLCKILHSIPKYIPISHMSPTSTAFQSHMLRALL